MSEDKLIRIENKLDIIKDDVSTIKVTLGSQHVSLVEHMRRTELLEEAVEPIKRHVAMVSGAFKLIGLIVSIAAVMESFVILLEYLRK